MHLESSVFRNVPFNPYHLQVTATGFAPYAQDVAVRSAVPIDSAIKLRVASDVTAVTVEAGGDLVENDPISHTDVDKNLFDRLPLESQSSSLSALVTQATAGVAADSNGLFHGLGDHAENSFSLDGQPITDQQSKVFSNQVPLDSVQSLEVRIWREDQLDHQCDDAFRPGNEDASWRCVDFVRLLRDGERWIECGLRRRKLGELPRCERPEERTLPRPPGVCSDA